VIDVVIIPDTHVRRTARYLAIAIGSIDATTKNDPTIIPGVTTVFGMK
jgi:hypothetical protein